MVSRRALQLALRRQLLAYCDGIVPAVRREWESKRTTREAGTQSVADKLAPSTRSLAGHMAMRGIIEHTGLYLIHWSGLPNAGLELSDTADELVALYPPGTSFVTDDGNAVQVMAEVAPWAGEVRQVGSSPLVTITVPYLCKTSAQLTVSAPAA